ncbi:hypothetical protein CLV63_1514 [Murinocardiopsis flavida]|uniref:Uncharacterized protein n=1 Tax=Murinocardiopsis flavida TaxID=645275 RepID=A0A2P8C7B9_9ACTN|nr:hypothetical protein [Murinocardiopsis flavida]PSK80858.1 hypothetical protein CLV63_1514 [Murinocardiopsis flavida]
MTYDIRPSRELLTARSAHRAYRIYETHDHRGATEVTAVVREEWLGQGLPVLVSASTVADLSAELADGPNPGLPRRIATKPYFPTSAKDDEQRPG